MIDLEKLIKQLSAIKMTEEEREAQRRSFAYGNAKLHNPSITRELVDEVANNLKLEELYSLCDLGEEQHALFLWLDRNERELSQGNFNIVDSELNQLQVYKLAPSFLLGVLSLTYPAKKNLKNRESFLVRTRDYLELKIGVDRTTKLLRGRS